VSKDKSAQDEQPAAVEVAPESAGAPNAYEETAAAGDEQAAVEEDLAEERLAMSEDEIKAKRDEYEATLSGPGGPAEEEPEAKAK
jgi:hypothetical protein